MPRTCRRPAPPQDRPSTNNLDAAQSSDHTDIDRALLAGKDPWVELFDGRFRLAVKCDCCNRWLTAGTSKSRGRGPVCAARAVR